MLAKRRLAPSFVRTVPAAVLVIGALPGCAKPQNERPAPEIYTTNPPMPLPSAAAPESGAGEPDAAHAAAAAACPDAAPNEGTTCAPLGAYCMYHPEGSPCGRGLACEATDTGPRWRERSPTCNPPPPPPPPTIHKNPPAPPHRPKLG